MPFKRGEKDRGGIERSLEDSFDCDLRRWKPLDNDFKRWELLTMTLSGGEVSLDDDLKRWTVMIEEVAVTSSHLAPSSCEG